MSAPTLTEIHEALSTLGGWGSVYVPEFTYGDKRIDVALVDVKTRWIRGFEIKMSRSDYLADEKWVDYVQFCSSLSIACPWGLIEKKEVPKPFGLLWIRKGQWGGLENDWVQRPKRFQTRDGLAWLFTYMRVIEKELPRLDLEVNRLKQELKYERERKAVGT